MPKLDIKDEIANQNAVRVLIRLGLVRSAHDCSDGGLAVALAECCFNPDELLGADIDLSAHSGRRPGGKEREIAGETPTSTAQKVCGIMFNEAQSRIIISCSPKNAERVLSELKSKNIPHAQIGSVIGNDLRISVCGENLSWRTAELHDLWWNAIRHAVASDSEPIPSL